MAQLPLARQTGLIIEEIPDEVLVYDSDRDSALCLNDTAAFVWKHCDGKTTPTQIARLIEKDFHITEGKEVVALALEQLQKSHLLIGKTPEHVPGMSRRELIRRLGATATLPVIAFILVGPAGSAASCTQNTGGCEFNSDCCSGCCSDATCSPANFCGKQ